MLIISDSKWSLWLYVHHPRQNFALKDSLLCVSDLDDVLLMCNPPSRIGIDAVQQNDKCHPILKLLEAALEVELRYTWHLLSAVGNPKLPVSGRLVLFALCVNSYLSHSPLRLDGSRSALLFFHGVSKSHSLSRGIQKYETKEHTLQEICDLLACLALISWMSIPTTRQWETFMAVVDSADFSSNIWEQQIGLSCDSPSATSTYLYLRQMTPTSPPLDTSFSSLCCGWIASFLDRSNSKHSR